MPKPIDDNEGFCYVCLWPHVTGLPMRVWAPDDAALDGSLRAQTSHTAASDPNQVALLSVSEEPELVDGELPEPDLSQVKAFITRNLAALRAHRNGDCDSGELAYRLKRWSVGSTNDRPL